MVALLSWKPASYETLLCEPAVPWVVLPWCLIFSWLTLEFPFYEDSSAQWGEWQILLGVHSISRYAAMWASMFGRQGELAHLPKAFWKPGKVLGEMPTHSGRSWFNLSLKRSHECLCALLTVEFWAGKMPLKMLSIFKECLKYSFFCM